MKAPEVQRDGDTWALAWHEQGISIGFERISERRDGLRAEVMVDSGATGRVLGPVDLNLLSSSSQTTFANACAKRVNGLTADVWHAIVIQGCAIVARDFRKPAPTLELDQVPDEGPIEYLDDPTRKRGLGLLPKGETIVLYGDGESAKSLFALRISLSVTLGAELPWGPTPAQGNVLYLDWETNPRTVASRLRRLAHGECVETPKVFYRQCFRGLIDELPSVKEEISRKHISLVVVDSIGFAATGALTDDETARTSMNALRTLSPCTRLVVAHISKADAESTGRAKPFGSQFFWNGLRSGVEMRRSLESPSDDVIDVGVLHQKANDGKHMKPFAMTVTFDTESDGILFTKSEIAEIPDLAVRTSMEGRLRALLMKGARSPDELATDVDKPRSDVIRVLRRMNDAVEVGQTGKWGLLG